MNHARENVGGVGVAGRRQVVPEWEGLRKEETRMRRALNRWHSKNELQGSLRVSDQRERKIAGPGEIKTKLDDTKNVVKTRESANKEMMVTPKGRDGKEEVSKPSTMRTAHFQARPNVTPRRMKSTNFLDVPSLGVNRQRSLRQPNYSDKDGAVSRSKSEQGQFNSGQSGACRTTNPSGLRRSFAKRGQSVRNISGSHIEQPMPSAVPESQSRGAGAPTVTKSFVSVESQALASLEEEPDADNKSSQFSASEDTADNTAGKRGETPAISQPKLEKGNKSSDEIAPNRKAIAKRGLSVRKIPSFDDSAEGKLSGGASWRPRSPMRGPSSKGKRAKPLVSLSPKSSPVEESKKPQAPNSPLDKGSSGNPGQDNQASPASPPNVGLSVPCPVSPPLHGPLKATLISPVRRKGISPVRRQSRRIGENGALSPTRQVSCRSPTLRVVKTQGSVELRRIMPLTDLPVGLVNLSCHSRSTESKPAQQKVAQNTNLVPKEEDVLSGLSPTPPPQIKRAATSPMRRALSSRSLCRSPSKVAFRPGLSKSPVPNRMGSRPTMSQRLLSFRSIVSVNTNVAVSDEIYPNKLKRQTSTTDIAEISRESSGEYGSKAVQRKSLLARLGSFRNSATAAAAAAATASDDLTHTSAEDDEEEEQARAGAKRMQRQMSQRQLSQRQISQRGLPDEGALVQKQQERRTLLARMSRRDLDDKTESTSVSKAVDKVQPRENDRRASLKASYVPDFIYFRVFTELNDNPDDASVITEAFSMCASVEGSDFIMDDDTAPPLEYINQKQPESDEAQESGDHGANSTEAPPENESLLNTCEEILKDDEQHLSDEEQDNAIVESLLNISPAPAPKIPMMKSLCTRTVWKLDDSDGSLYVDKPEHENVGGDDDEAAYESEVLGELEKVKPQWKFEDDEEEQQPKKTKIKKKNLRRVEPRERLLIEL